MKDKTVKKSGKGLRIVFVLIMAVLLGIIGFCVYNIIIIQNEYNESKDAFQAVADLVVKKIEVPASDDNKSEVDRKSTRLNSSHTLASRMPSSA